MHLSYLLWPMAILFLAFVEIPKSEATVDIVSPITNKLNRIRDTIVSFKQRLNPFSQSSTRGKKPSYNAPKPSYGSQKPSYKQQRPGGNGGNGGNGGAKPSYSNQLRPPANSQQGGGFGYSAGNSGVTREEMAALIREMHELIHEMMQKNNLDVGHNSVGSSSQATSSYGSANTNSNFASSSVGSSYSSQGNNQQASYTNTVAPLSTVLGSQSSYNSGSSGSSYSGSSGSSFSGSSGSSFTGSSASSFSGSGSQDSYGSPLGSPLSASSSSASSFQPTNSGAISNYAAGSSVQPPDSYVSPGISSTLDQYNSGLSSIRTSGNSVRIRRKNNLKQDFVASPQYNPQRVEELLSSREAKIREILNLLENRRHDLDSAESSVSKRDLGAILSSIDSELEEERQRLLGDDSSDEGSEDQATDIVIQQFIY